MTDSVQHLTAHPEVDHGDVVGDRFREGRRRGVIV